MKTGRPKRAVVLSDEERVQLSALAKSRSLPHGLVQRVRLVLMAADGLSNTAIAKHLDLSQQSVCLWRQRYLARGFQGLHEELRPGRPRSISDEQVALLVRKTLHNRPKGRTHWSTRSMARATHVSTQTVRRVWRAFGLQPHREESFQISPDPFFVEKVRDIVGLYLNPPDHAVTLALDEKSQIQALDRTQPILPLGLGYVEGLTHTYERHGTTTLFAALNITSGKVITSCKRRHRHQEYLAFLKRVDENVPRALDIHLIVDNYATHKHPVVTRWLALHPRYHVHYTPTYASWLNQVEIWFNIITQQAIRRGTFRSVKELVRKIDEFVQTYNKNAHPFVWTATADSILAKIQRLCQFISGSQH
jgi:putative transposase